MNNARMDDHLVGEIVTEAVKITKASRACLLLYDSAQDRLECSFGENCSCFGNNKCSIPLPETPVRLQRLFENHTEAGGFVTQDRLFPTKGNNGVKHSSSQMIVPLPKPNGKPLGLLVLELQGDARFQAGDLGVAESAAGLCSLAMRKSQKLADKEQKLADSDRMIKKLGLLSQANNVLLAEFENKSLSEKLDHIVEKTTEILEAELCSLWLVKEGEISLETSYSQEGKVFKKRVFHPIKDVPRSKDEPKPGMTGYIAFRKEIFNIYGKALDEHPARNPENPVDFLDSQKVYSELAHPMLDGDNLIGLLLAYNKLGPDGQPIQNAGFSKELDEPLMKVLAAKLVISIKNAHLLKTLKDYQLIVESTPDPVVMCDNDGWIRYMNQGAKNLFGDFVGCHVTERYPSDENSTGKDKARDILRQVRRRKDKRLKNYETTFTDKEGEPIPISLSVSLLHNEHGQETGTIGIAKDQREIRALLDAGRSLVETHNIDDILEQITKLCLRLPNSVRAYFKLYDDKKDVLVFKALNSRLPDEKEFPVAFTPKEKGVTGYVFQIQRPMLYNDVPALPIDRYNAIFQNVRSKLIVPVTYIEKETGNIKKRGVISVDSEELKAFSNNDLYFLTTLANHAAVALENAHLIASKNDIITRLRAIDMVQQAATGKDPVEDQILESILNAVVDILGFEYATISIVDPAKRAIGTIKGRGVPEEFLRAAWHSLDSKDIQAWVARHKQPEYLTGWDKRLDQDIFEKFGHKRWVRTIIPIFARGEVLGTLETGHDKAHKSEIASDEIETLQRIVNLAGIGIEQANLLNQMKQELALRNELEMQLDALNQASIEILNAATEKEAIERIFGSLLSIGYAKGMLSLVNEATSTIEGRHAIGENWKAIVHRTHCELKSKDILAQALRTKSPIWVKDCETDARCDTELIHRAGIKSQYVIPLIAKDKAIGTLQIDLTDHSELVHGDEIVLGKRMKVVETFAQQVAIAIRNIRDLIKIDRLESNIAETAHEFRAPLHNIMTQVGGLKFRLEQSRLDKEIDQYVGAIEEEIMRAKRHMDNTLLLSDRTREKLEYVFKAGYLQDLIDACISVYNFRALERGLRFTVKDGVKRLPRIEFDRDRMEQAINNLIDNAIKYSHYNRLIIINGYDDGTNLNFEITDRGLGIPAHELETIFKGFSRGDARDKMRYIPGTGLGLKICREIILKHGGEVKVKSEPATKNPQKIREYQDYWTTFRVILPKHRREK